MRNQLREALDSGLRPCFARRLGHPGDFRPLIAESFSRGTTRRDLVRTRRLATQTPRVSLRSPSCHSRHRLILDEGRPSVKSGAQAGKQPSRIVDHHHLAFAHDPLVQRAVDCQLNDFERAGLVWLLLQDLAPYSLTSQFLDRATTQTTHRAKRRINVSLGIDRAVDVGEANLGGTAGRGRPSKNRRQVLSLQSGGFLVDLAEYVRIGSGHASHYRWSTDLVRSPDFDGYSFRPESRYRTFHAIRPRRGRSARA